MIVYVVSKTYTDILDDVPDTINLFAKLLFCEKQTIKGK